MYNSVANKAKRSMSLNRKLKPDHYSRFKIVPWDVIEDWKLSFNLGNVIKFVARAPHKGSQLLDLKKAHRYLDREIKRIEAGE